MRPVEPALRQAAVLLTHWQNKDVEAVVLLVADMTRQDAEDVITALLLLHGRPAEKIRELVRTPQAA
jgi:hypothetical protein